MEFYVVFSSQGCNFGMCTSMAKKCTSSTCKWNNVPGIFFTVPKFFISGKKCLTHYGNILSTRITKRIWHFKKIISYPYQVRVFNTPWSTISGASKTWNMKSAYLDFGNVAIISFIFDVLINGLGYWSNIPWKTFAKNITGDSSSIHCLSFVLAIKYL